MIVTLSNSVAVNPERVESIVTDPDGQNDIRIHMIDGKIHSVKCRYGKSIFATRDEVVAELNLPFMKELRIEGDLEVDEFLRTVR